MHLKRKETPIHEAMTSDFARANRACSGLKPPTQAPEGKEMKSLGLPLHPNLVSF